MKKYILGIITGLIVSGIIGVSATILYNANEVGFTPTDPNWNVNNLEEALNDLYTNRSGNITYIIGQNNTSTGTTSYTIEHDNDNAIIMSGQVSLDYSINSTENFQRLDAYGANSNGMGTYYKQVSLKKGDIIYLKRNSSGIFGYIIAY